MVYKRSILLLGMFLGSLAPIAAQTPLPRIVAQERAVPIITTLGMLATPSPTASFLLSQDAGKSNSHFSFLFAGAYPRDSSLEHLSPIDEHKTFILTRSTLPLVQLWGGRLQLDAFQSTLHIQNVQLGPFRDGITRGSRLSGQSYYLGGSRSLHLSGLCLSFQFGRDARTGHPEQLWRRLTRIVGTVLN